MKLKSRLIKSFALGALWFSFVIIGFNAVQNSEPVDGIAGPLRTMLKMNDWVWEHFQSQRKLSVHKKNPAKGTKPRFNGNIGLESPLDLEHYRVTILNGEKSSELPLSAFYALPKVGYSTDFRCIEGWSEVVHYEGARFSEFMEAYHLGKKPDGSLYRYVGFETPDGEYYVSIDMDSMVHPQTVLSYEMNEMPLSIENGYPLRLSIPLKYGIKHIKRIGKITFSDTRPPDYWADEGYDWFAGF